MGTKYIIVKIKNKTPENLSKNTPLILKQPQPFSKGKFLIERDFWNKIDISKLLTKTNILLVISVSLALPTIYTQLSKDGDLKKAVKKIIKTIAEHAFASQNMNNFFYNEYIFSGKIKENQENRRVSYSCRHFFINIQIEESLVITKDFPKFGLYVGMVGRVKKILGDQRIEVEFISNSNFSGRWKKIDLEKCETCFVKEKSNGLKNFF